MVGFPRGRSLLWPVVLMMAPGAASASQPARDEPTARPNAVLIRDMVRLGFCSPPLDKADCQGALDGVAPVSKIWIDRSRSIFTVEGMFFLGISKNNAKAAKAEQRAVRLVHYFLPDWTAGAGWVARKFEISRDTLCPQITRYRGFTVVVAQQMVNTEEGTFISVVITRSGSPGEVMSQLGWGGCSLDVGKYGEK